MLYAAILNLARLMIGGKSYKKQYYLEIERYIHVKYNVISMT